MAKQEQDHLVRNVGIAAGALTVAIIAIIVTPELMRDKWESNNAARVLAKLEEADRLQQSDPLKAYKTYDEVLKEAQQHKVKDELLTRKLADAEKSRAALYPQVQDKIRAEEAEKQRRAEEEAERAADEKQRVAEEEAQKRAAEEAQRLAEEKRRAVAKRCAEAVTVYRNAPQSARGALNAVKKVEARTEIGINYNDYSTVVGEAWGDVKIFIESPDGKKVPEFSMLLAKAMADYKSALDIWKWKIEFHTLYGGRADVEALHQRCWERAGKWIKLAEALLDADKTENALKEVAALPGNDEDLDAAWKAIQDRVLNGTDHGS